MIRKPIKYDPIAFAAYIEDRKHRPDYWIKKEMDSWHRLCRYVNKARVVRK